MIDFMFITNDTELASYAESSGVQRIFVDLESMGKLERQGHLDTHISSHTLADVARIKSALTSARLLVRLNPLHAGSRNEVEHAIEDGADLLMLPMFRDAQTVRTFCELVDGRVPVIPLVETGDAARAVRQIAEIDGVSEVYFGLNDLHLDMGLTFMFELVANGYVENMADEVKSVGKPFGFGGIARVGEGVVPGEAVLGEHLRLGSSSVILSRTFHRKSQGVDDLKQKFDLVEELERLRTCERELSVRTVDQQVADKQAFQASVADFVSRRRS